MAFFLFNRSWTSCLISSCSLGVYPSVFSAVGGSIGKAALSISEVTFNQQINAITPIFASSKYVFAVLTSFAFLSAMKESAGGTATPTLP